MISLQKRAFSFGYGQRLLFGLQKYQLYFLKKMICGNFGRLRSTLPRGLVQQIEYLQKCEDQVIEDEKSDIANR